MDHVDVPVMKGRKPP